MLQPYSEINFFLVKVHTIPQNDGILDIFENVFTKVFRPFTQYFVKAPLAAITASSLLGYDATSLAHLYLGSFSHSSLQILSSSVRLDGECRCTAIFRSPEMLDRGPGAG